MRVPKKNISRRIADVKRPEKGVRGEDSQNTPIHAEELAKIGASRESPGAPPVIPPMLTRAAGKAPRRLTRIFAAVAVGVILVVGLIVASLYHVRALIEEAVSIQPAVEMKPTFGDVVRNLIPLLKDAGRAYRGLGQLSSGGVLLARHINELEQNGLGMMLEGRGGDLLALLRDLRADIASTTEAIASFAENGEGITNVLPFGTQGFLAAQVGLTRSAQFLDTLIPWLAAKGERRIAVFLENPAELRPAGGFLGSYAEVVVKSGSITSVEVRDINEVDRGFEERIVPPEPLQGVETRWRAADANWFFDFPTSATKVLRFMEQSRLYRDRRLTFDGAVVISPKVVSDVLAVTGPLELPGDKSTFDENNFWIEVQNRVHQAEERGDRDPKKILKELAPALLKRVTALGGEEKRALAARAREWGGKKDMLVYFKNPVFEDFFRAHDLTGHVYELPSDFNGDYLAVVSANVDGGKSDLFMKQRVTLTSQILADGSITNHLAIDRVHGGNKAKQWWYRTENRSYLKVFTLLGATPAGLSGAWEREIRQRANYRSQGYAVDPEVQAVERTAKTSLNYPGLAMLTESGKNVFAFWTKTPVGTTRAITLDYTHRLASLPADGGAYQFVFEKQPGSTGQYKFEFNAPVGFRWRENSLPLYEYATDDPPGRVVLDLTFEKAP